MSSKKETTAPTLTSRDMELLVGALKCTKTEFTIDYPKFAEMVGLKNAASATTAWHGLRRKIEKVTGAKMTAPEPAVSTTASKKRKPDEEVDEAAEPVKKDEEVDEEEAKPAPAPVKKTPAKKGRGKKAKTEEVEDAAATE